MGPQQYSTGSCFTAWVYPIETELEKKKKAMQIVTVALQCDTIHQSYLQLPFPPELLEPSSSSAENGPAPCSFTNNTELQRFFWRQLPLGLCGFLQDEDLGPNRRRICDLEGTILGTWDPSGWTFPHLWQGKITLVGGARSTSSCSGR